ncbi:MAG: triacylglycerol lipase [Clostridia bacterium]|nr:triacylglycerol lipase [Clostridia bacterium]
MSRYKYIFRILFLILFAFAANSYFIVLNNPGVLVWAIAAFVVVNFFTGFTDLTVKRWLFKITNHGKECLIIFVTAIMVSIVWHGVYLAIIPWDLKQFLWSALWCTIAHFILFWNGIISVYCTSVQLGIKHRAIGLLCGMIPVANLFALRTIIKVTEKEIYDETKKDLENRARKQDELCKTKYPILLVHGVFFRDYKYLNYWGRIPYELKRNGATLFYGEHQSALSVADSAKELSERIKKIAKDHGGKVNIIAHSKGGLDCRYAIAECGAAEFVASLTTINTPHRGCEFADSILEKIPQETKLKIADAYNAAAKKLGDTSPDFLAAVNDLTFTACEKMNKSLPLPKDIYCQSVGSVLEKASGGKFPLNFSYHIVKFFDGENDGLVSEKSFEWGEIYTCLKNTGKRGISHGDMIDLNRENIEGFDVREFYVQLVHDLKKRGF